MNEPTELLLPAPAPVTPLVKPSTPDASSPSVSALLDEPTARPWYRRPLYWGIAAGVILIIAGISYWQIRKTENAKPVFNTAAAAAGDLTLTVVANGTLQPTLAINIGSELSGTVLKVNVDVNDVVKKDQVLVELDTAKLRDQILRSRATLSAATSKVAQTAATLQEARATLDRYLEVARLSGGKVPAKTELDTARATLQRATADDASARAGIADSQAALSTDEISLSKASIRAPADGIILTRTVDPGNTVAASFQAVTLFTEAEDLARLRLQVYVDEADVGSVKTGQTGSFTVSAYPARVYPSKVTRVAFGSTITDNVVTYITYLDVDNADLSLRPGMTATADIIATHRTGVLLVPNTALRFEPAVAGAAVAAKAGMFSGMGPPKITRKSAATSASTATAKQVYILPADGSGVPQAVAVTPGISDGRMTEITGGDLKAGMLVITDQKSAAAK
jgi:HlyD family secretion protein